MLPLLGLSKSRSVGAGAHDDPSMDVSNSPEMMLYICLITNCQCFVSLLNV